MKTQSDIYFYANEKKNNYVRQQKKLDYLQYKIQLSVSSSYVYACLIENRIFYFCISMSNYTEFFVMVHSSKFTAIASKRPQGARRGLSIFPRASAREEISSQRCSERRKADRPAKLGTTTASSRLLQRS